MLWVIKGVGKKVKEDQRFLLEVSEILNEPEKYNWALLHADIQHFRYTVWV